MKVIIAIIALLISVGCHAQSTDIFIMLGSDFTRPGVRSNMNIGVGRTLKSLNKSPVGKELTFSYTYENAGSHGFWNSDKAAHTEAAGIMKTFTIKPLTMYSSQQVGLTTFAGAKLQNRFYNATAVGFVHSISPHSGIWIQETYNKVETTHWYITSGFGLAFSF